MDQQHQKNTAWKKNWISEVHIQLKRPQIQETKDYLAYDMSDLIGDLGGYLGLCLGWSILGIVVFVLDLTTAMIYRFKGKN